MMRKKKRRPEVTDFKGPFSLRVFRTSSSKIQQPSSQGGCLAAVLAGVEIIAGLLPDERPQSRCAQHDMFQPRTTCRASQAERILLTGCGCGTFGATRQNHCKAVQPLYTLVRHLCLLPLHQRCHLEVCARCICFIGTLEVIAAFLLPFALQSIF